MDREQMGEVDRSDVELSMRNKKKGFLNWGKKEREGCHCQIAI